MACVLKSIQWYISMTLYAYIMRADTLINLMKLHDNLAIGN